MELKTIGLIGGMSCEATTEYYRKLTRQISRNCGQPFNTGRVVVHSVNLRHIYKSLLINDWNSINKNIQNEIALLKTSGVDIFGVCSNTIHAALEHQQIESGFVDIIPPTIKSLINANKKRAILLSTTDTARYKLYELYNDKITIVIPSVQHLKKLDYIIFKYLVKGKIYKSYPLVNKLCNQLNKDYYFDSVILGCTELSLIKDKLNFNVDKFDSLSLHVDALIKAAAK